MPQKPIEQNGKCACQANRTDTDTAPHKRSFSEAAIVWMTMTISMYDARKNGFGVSSAVWSEVRRRGWYKTTNGWLGLTAKGREEIPVVIAAHHEGH